MLGAAFSFSFSFLIFFKLSFIWWLIFDEIDKEQQQQTNEDLAIPLLFNYEKDARDDHEPLAGKPMHRYTVVRLRLVQVIS